MKNAGKLSTGAVVGFSFLLIGFYSCVVIAYVILTGDLLVFPFGLNLPNATIRYAQGSREFLDKLVFFVLSGAFSLYAAALILRTEHLSRKENASRNFAPDSAEGIHLTHGALP